MAGVSVVTDVIDVSDEVQLGERSWIFVSDYTPSKQ
jgi:hypothetical protein